MRLLSTVAYDGTNYFGFQKAREGNSIESTIAHSIFKVSGVETQVICASRTDKGVHAKAQNIVFSIEKELPLRNLQKAINAHLPPDIRILNITEVSENFHPTIEAQEKEYRYYLSLESFQSPIDRLYSWHIPQKLDLERMKAASLRLIGTKDFSAYSTKKSMNPVCTITSIDMVQIKNKLEIRIRGDRFLYKMVRMIVGSLVNTGKGGKSLKMTAPAHGLFLYRVIY